jgi:uncharacterized protein (TIGR02246 family)
MMRFGTGLLVYFLISNGVLAAPPVVKRIAASSVVSAEARTLLETQAASWNRGDLDGFCSVYADDALFLTAFGLTKGRAEVLARYKARYPDSAARGTLSFEVLSVDVLAPSAPKGTPDAVAVVARWTISHPDRPAATGLTLLNLVRAPGGWRIVHDASM